MVEQSKKIEVVPNEYLTEHFMYSEFVCPCCDQMKIVPGVFKHMALLEHMRQFLDFPMVINSGYRCPDHNKSVGGTARSWHLLFATDVRPEDGDMRDLRFMYRMALELDFGGIGYYETRGLFIHLDMRPEKLLGGECNLNRR